MTCGVCLSPINVGLWLYAASVSGEVVLGDVVGEKPVLLGHLEQPVRVDGVWPWGLGRAVRCQATAGTCTQFLRDASDEVTRSPRATP